MLYTFTGTQMRNRLSMSLGATLQVTELRTDTAVVGSTLKVADLVMEDVAGVMTTPCVIRRIHRGSLGALAAKPPKEAQILVYPLRSHTAHTEAGYMEVQVISTAAHLIMYIHANNLETLLAWALPRALEHLKTKT